MGGSGGRPLPSRTVGAVVRWWAAVNGSAEAPGAVDEAPGDMELRLVEYNAFLDRLLDRRKHLQKWLDGMKGLRETGIKQDRVTVVAVSDAISEGVAAHSKVKLKDKEDLKAFVTNVGAGILPVLEKALKDRRSVDKYFDQAVGKLAEMILAGDAQVVGKCMELLNNIEVNHAQEVQRMKLQVADLLTAVQDLAAANDALMTGAAVKPREIPGMPDSGETTVSCQVCRSVHAVAPGTQAFECPVCGAVIKT